MIGVPHFRNPCNIIPSIFFECRATTHALLERETGLLPGIIWLSWVGIQAWTAVLLSQRTRDLKAILESRQVRHCTSLSITQLLTES